MARFPDAHSQREYKPVKIQEYFDLVSRLVKEGTFYKNPDKRFIVPLKQLAHGPFNSVKQADTEYVKLKFDPKTMAQWSPEKILEEVNKAAERLALSDIPDNCEIAWADMRSVQRSHIPDPDGRPYHYINKQSLEADSYLLCIPIAGKVSWPTPNMPIDLDDGAAIAVTKKDLPELKRRLDDIRTSLENDDTDPNGFIRHHMFQVGGGEYPSTKVGVAGIQPEIFAHFEPV